MVHIWDEMKVEQCQTETQTGAEKAENIETTPEEPPKEMTFAFPNYFGTTKSTKISSNSDICMGAKNVPRPRPSSLDLKQSPSVDQQDQGQNSVDSGIGESLSSSRTSLNSVLSAKSDSPLTSPSMAPSEFSPHNSDELPQPDTNEMDGNFPPLSRSSFVSMSSDSTHNDDVTAPLKLESAATHQSSPTAQNGQKHGTEVLHDAVSLSFDDYMNCKNHDVPMILFCTSCIEDSCNSCWLVKHDGHCGHGALKCKEIFDIEVDFRKYTVVSIERADKILKDATHYLSAINRAMMELLLMFPHLKAHYKSMNLKSNEFVDVIVKRLKNVRDSAKRVLTQYIKAMKGLSLMKKAGNMGDVHVNAKHVRMLIEQLCTINKTLAKESYEQLVSDSVINETARKIAEQTVYAPLLTNTIQNIINILELPLLPTSASTSKSYFSSMNGRALNGPPVNHGASEAVSPSTSSYFPLMRSSFFSNLQSTPSPVLNESFIFGRALNSPPANHGASVAASTFTCSSLPPMRSPIFCNLPSTPSPVVSDSFIFANQSPIQPHVSHVNISAENINLWPNADGGLEQQRISTSNAEASTSQLDVVVSAQPSHWKSYRMEKSNAARMSPMEQQGSAMQSFDWNSGFKKKKKGSPMESSLPYGIEEEAHQTSNLVSRGRTASEIRRSQLQPLLSPSVGPFQVGYHTSRQYTRFRRPVTVLEGAGNGPTSLSRPWGVCCDQSNNIIIADRSNNRIQMFRTDGSHVRHFGSFGSGPGELNKPAGVAVDIYGRIVVVDKDNHRIQVFSGKGEYLFHFGRYGNLNGEFYYPWDVSCSKNGKIAVSDSRNHRVQIFDSNGVFLKKFGYEVKVPLWTVFDCPRGVHFFGDDQLFVTDFNNHRLVELDFSNRRSQTLSVEKFKRHLFHRPQGMAQDGDGNLLVCDSRNNCIKVFTPRGAFVGQFGVYGKEPGQFDRPCDVAVAPDGKVVVVDLDNNRVQIF